MTQVESSCFHPSSFRLHPCIYSLSRLFLSRCFANFIRLTEVGRPMSRIATANRLLTRTEVNYTIDRHSTFCAVSCAKSSLPPLACEPEVAAT
jgi:hypothetical protein